MTRNDLEMEFLSTGYHLLDQKFKHHGVPPGTVVGVRTAPNAPSRVFLHNLVGNRDALYLTTTDRGRTATHLHRQLAGLYERRGQTVGRFDAVELTVNGHTERSATTVLDRARDVLDERGVPNHGVVVVDVVDDLERTSTGAYREFLRQLEAELVDARAIGALRMLSPDTIDVDPPAGRPFTLDACPVVFRLVHRSGRDNVTDYCAIDKVDFPALLRQDERNDRLMEVIRVNEVEVEIDPRRGVDPGDG
jgi:hypothetical protein